MRDCGARRVDLNNCSRIVGLLTRPRRVPNGRDVACNVSTNRPCQCSCGHGMPCPYGTNRRLGESCPRIFLLRRRSYGSVRAGGRPRNPRRRSWSRCRNRSDFASLCERAVLFRQAEKAVSVFGLGVVPQQQTCPQSALLQLSPCAVGIASPISPSTRVGAE